LVASVAAVLLGLLLFTVFALLVPLASVFCVVVVVAFADWMLTTGVVAFDEAVSVEDVEFVPGAGSATISLLEACAVELEGVG
jgi:hypothetical protein